MTPSRSTGLVDEEMTFAHVRAAEEAARSKLGILAAKKVAEYAHDATECAHLLEMLGLDLSELTADSALSDEYREERK